MQNLSKYSRGELQEIIKKAAEVIPASDKAVDTAQVGSKWLSEMAKIQLCTNQLQHKENTRVQKYILGISILSLCVALAALFISYK